MDYLCYWIKITPNTFRVLGNLFIVTASSCYIEDGIYLMCIPNTYSYRHVICFYNHIVGNVYLVCHVRLYAARIFDTAVDFLFQIKWVTVHEIKLFGLLQYGSFFIVFSCFGNFCCSCTSSFNLSVPQALESGYDIWTANIPIPKQRRHAVRNCTVLMSF